MNRLYNGDILTLDLNDNILEGVRKPLVKTIFNLEINRNRKNVDTILHINPPFATVYAVVGKQMPMVTEASRITLD